MSGVSVAARSFGRGMGRGPVGAVAGTLRVRTRPGAAHQRVLPGSLPRGGRTGGHAGLIDPPQGSRGQVRRRLGRGHLVQQAQYPLDRLKPAAEVWLITTHCYCAPVIGRILGRSTILAVAPVAAAPRGQLAVEQQVNGTAVVVTDFLRHWSPWLCLVDGPIAVKPGCLARTPLALWHSHSSRGNRERLAKRQ